MRSGVYEILSKINNRMYYGSAIDVPDRFCTHRYKLRENKHPNRMLQNAWNKYGEESFVFKKIITCDIKDLLFYEQMMMDEFQSHNKKFGYNIRKIASSNAGMPMHANTKAAMKLLWQRPEYLAKRLKYKIGDKIGNITLLSMVESRVNGGNIWLCHCRCGMEWRVATRSFNNGIRSCGCMHPLKFKQRQRIISACIERLKAA